MFAPVAVVVEELLVMIFVIFSLIALKLNVFSIFEVVDGAGPITNYIQSPEKKISSYFK
jgi:hypothetical protein